MRNKWLCNVRDKNDLCLRWITVYRCFVVIWYCFFCQPYQRRKLSSIQLAAYKLVVGIGQGCVFFFCCVWPFCSQSFNNMLRIYANPDYRDYLASCSHPWFMIVIPSRTRNQPFKEKTLLSSIKNPYGSMYPSWDTAFSMKSRTENHPKRNQFATLS